MATNVTRAKPIISAEAVDAVRFVLRIVLSRASTPAAPPMRVAGQPRIEARGRTRRAEVDEKPEKSSTTPKTRETRRVGVEKTVTRPPSTVGRKAKGWGVGAQDGNPRAQQAGGG